MGVTAKYIAIKQIQDIKVGGVAWLLPNKKILAGK
jgi:hypothetical protein